MTIRVLAGTDKGAFVLTADDDRSSWSIEGPLFKGWKVTAATRGADGRFVVATASQVYGPALHRSRDLATWEQVVDGPAWPKETGRTMKQIWTLANAPDRMYAGVDEAGLFASEDGGATWQPVDGLNEHPTRAGWFPGAGGLCLHSILVDPDQPQRVWCGISAVGVFCTDDGGRTWATKNEGVPVLIEDETHKDIGRCVHGLVADPENAEVIYRRDHVGMFRSRDGGDHWERAEEGLSSWFGFPIAMDRRTRTLFVVPLESDEYRLPPGGRFEVYRSRDGGDSDPCGVYIGTTAGTVHVSSDAGDTWRQLPCILPRIFCVKAFVD
jgi:photosystem II stability/assembly factor-like uncharacterized protein